MKIAVRRGHQYTGEDTSSVGIVKEIEVADRYYKKVINGLKAVGHEVLDVTPPEANRSLSDSLNYGVNKANNWGADLFVSCHANNAYNWYQGTIGCEVIYNPGSVKGKDYGAKVERELSNIGFRSRGAKEDTRGLAELKRTNMPAIIVEPFFVEATGDVAIYNRVGDDGIANAIVKGITGKDIPNYGGGNKKYYIITNYLDEGEHGVEINNIIKKYFGGLDRIYIRRNDKGIWIETQYLSYDLGMNITAKLKEDNLLWNLASD